MRKVVDKTSGEILFVGTLMQCAEYVAIKEMKELFKK